MDFDCHDLWGEGDYWREQEAGIAVQRPQGEGQSPPKLLMALRLRNPGLVIPAVFRSPLKVPKDVTEAVRERGAVP